MFKIRVFVAGSRSVSRLNDLIRGRLDSVMAEGHDVLIGDARGADRVVQQYLAEHRYSQVVVYFTRGRCRNNVGGWRTVAVDPPPGVNRGFEFYAVKDRQMAAAATHGLMLWDGESRGTFTNIKNLIAARKPVIVYLSPAKTFVIVRTESDLADLREKATPFALSVPKARAYPD